MALVNTDLAVLTGERDSNKVARRPPRQAELEGQAAAQSRDGGGVIWDSLSMSAGRPLAYRLALPGPP
jgi:hypothetical protein